MDHKADLAFLLRKLDILLTTPSCSWWMKGSWAEEVGFTAGRYMALAMADYDYYETYGGNL